MPRHHPKTPIAKRITPRMGMIVFTVLLIVAVIVTYPTVAAKRKIAWLESLGGEVDTGPFRGTSFSYMSPSELEFGFFEVHRIKAPPGELTDEIVEAIQSLLSFEDTLDLSQVELRDEDLRHFQRLWVDRLILGNQPNLTDETFRILAEFPRVDHIELECPNIRGIYFERFRAIPTNFRLPNSSIDDAALIALLKKEWGQIRILDIRNSNVTDAGLAGIRPSRGFFAADFSGCPIRGEGLKHLPEFTTQLIIGSEELQDDAFSHIPLLKGLNNVRIENIHVSSQMIRDLARQKHLNTIEFRNVTLADDVFELLSESESHPRIALLGSTRLNAKHIESLAPRYKQGFGDILFSETARKALKEEGLLEQFVAIMGSHLLERPEPKPLELRTF